jgi:hypothetical protein
MIGCGQSTSLDSRLPVASSNIIFGVYSIKLIIPYSANLPDNNDGSPQEHHASALSSAHRSMA